MNFRRFVLVLITGAFVLGTYLYAQSGKSESATLFKTHCAMCHGADGKANTPVGKSLHIPDLLSPQVQNKTNAQLTAIITSGKGKMPEFKTKLTAEQIDDLVAYLRELPHAGK